MVYFNFHRTRNKCQYLLWMSEYMMATWVNYFVWSFCSKPEAKWSWTKMTKTFTILIYLTWKLILFLRERCINSVSDISRQRDYQLIASLSLLQVSFTLLAKKKKKQGEINTKQQQQGQQKSVVLRKIVDKIKKNKEVRWWGA